MSSYKKKSKKSRKKSKKSIKNHGNKPFILKFNRKEDDPRESMFPKMKGVNYKNLMLSNVSMYSIDHSTDAQYICDIIKSFFPNKKKIKVTDATSNVGGASISFAMNFSSVNSVELEPVHCKALRNNLQVYGYEKKVKIYCQSYLDVMNKLKQDITYIDPPWGGRDYKKTYNLDLFLGNENIINIINQIKKTNKLIVLKVPYNFNFIKFYLNVHFKDIKLHKINYKKNMRPAYYILTLSS